MSKHDLRKCIKEKINNNFKTHDVLTISKTNRLFADNIKIEKIAFDTDTSQLKNL